MDCDELTRIAQETTKKLSEAWATIGLTADEKQKEITALVNQVKAVYNDRVEVEKKNIDTMKATVEEQRKGIADIRSQLQIQAPAEEIPASVRDQDRLIHRWTCFATLTLGLLCAAEFLLCSLV